MAIVAKRYVKALLKSSKEDEQSIIFEKGLRDISNLFNSDKEFKKLLLNPCISEEEKINSLKEIFPEFLKYETFLNFLKELFIKNRINIIEDISNEYSKKISDLNKEVTIKIIVARELNEDQIRDIVNKYKEMYNANTIKYTVELNDGIIGGIKVIVGNKIYDDTLETQLKQIF